jgi:hypothetical protein
MKPLQERTTGDRFTPGSVYHLYKAAYEGITDTIEKFRKYKTEYDKFVNNGKSFKDLKESMTAIAEIPSADEKTKTAIKNARSSMITRDRKTITAELYKVNILLNKVISTINKLIDIFNEDNTKFSDKFKRMQAISKELETEMAGGAVKNRTRSKRDTMKRKTMKFRFIY